MNDEALSDKVRQAVADLYKELNDTLANDELIFLLAMLINYTALQQAVYYKGPTDGTLDTAAHGVREAINNAAKDLLNQDLKGLKAFMPEGEFKQHLEQILSSNANKA